MDRHLLSRISIVVSVLLFLIASAASHGAPAKKLLPQWQAYDANSTRRVDHSPWQQLLDARLSTHTGQTLFDYQAISPAQREILDSYITQLINAAPLQLQRAEQKAYWINLYNALTVQLILNHYPTTSITKLGKKWLSFGPWDDKLVRINDQSLTLNNIEHGILRPIYNDPRIHYAVNCASIGCPNLMATVFSADNIEQQLEQAARDFINHPRAVRIDGGTLYLSSIYEWYQVDFGDDERAVIQHLQRYANPALQQQLAAFAATKGKLRIKYDYDWSLNQCCLEP